jgi:ribonuclease D
MAIHLHKNDLPDGLTLGPIVAIDTETMGLDPRRDRLCVVQLADGKGDAHLVQIAKGQTSAPNLERLLTDPATLKLFHFGRFDIAALQKAFGVRTAPVWCTKIASRMIRTYTDRHGLKYLLTEYVGVDVSKAQQTSDWGRPPDRGAEGICGVGRAVSAQAERRAGGHPAPRRPDALGAGVFRFPARPRRTRPSGMG